MPCTIKLLPAPKPSRAFYDFERVRAAVDGAGSARSDAYLIVLLGGEAGLRCGEIMALEWARRRSCRSGNSASQRSDWKGHVTVPKGGRLRYVPLTHD